MGFHLTQKHCECDAKVPGCCENGWHTVPAGSKFTAGAESWYAPVEGEALAMAWALYKTRHFTLGSKKLTVLVDHKPLLKIMGDRELADIDNPRILNLKQKSGDSDAADRPKTTSRYARQYPCLAGQFPVDHRTRRP